MENEKENVQQKPARPFVRRHRKVCAFSAQIKLTRLMIRI